jgi:hypothetical protein
MSLFSSVYAVGNYAYRLRRVAGPGRSLLFILLSTTVLLAGDSRPLSDRSGWEALLHLQNREAARIFTESDSRQTRLGEALALINLQPQTRANFNQALALLSALYESNPHDTTGIAANYYLGRIEQLNPFGANPAQAAALYEALIQAHPNSPYAQMAAPKLAILKIYLLPRQNTHAMLLKQLADNPGKYLTEATAIRDFNLILADAYARFQISDDAALKHLLAVYHSGALVGKARSDVLLRIGELSRLLGDKEQAALFYQRFLDEFPRDQRTHTIRERLEAVS